MHPAFIKIRPSTLVAIATIIFLRFLTVASADNHVVVNAVADENYSRWKFAGDKPKAESYVVIPGKYFSGSMADQSLERMSFRQVATYLAPELARKEYWPSRSLEEADLLLVIHWGVITPGVSSNEIVTHVSRVIDLANTQTSIAQSIRPEGVGAASDHLGALGAPAAFNSAFANDILMMEAFADSNSRFNTAQFLHYPDASGRFGNSTMPSLSDVSTFQGFEDLRYFVVVEAYDLHFWKKGGENRSSWTIRLNVRSPGNDFRTALERMSLAGVNYFGRSSGDILSVKAKPREGHVSLAPLVILGDAN